MKISRGLQIYASNSTINKKERGGSSKMMLNNMEEVTLQVRHFIPFIWFRGKGCIKSFSVIKYTYVACLRFTVRFVFVVYSLIVFMVYWTLVHPEPCHASKMELEFGVFCENV